MTKREESPFRERSTSRRQRALGLFFAFGACGAATTAVQACGSSSSDVSCGKGTTQSGSECVATSLTGAGGKGDGDGGPSGGSAGDEGTGGRGNASGGRAADGGDPEVEALAFAGITSASPASQTPPKAKDAVADSIRLSWAKASYPARPLAVIRYEIFEAAEAGQENFLVPLDTAPPGSTSYVVQDRDPSKTYYYVVRAVADVGAARDTNVVELHTSPAFDDTPPDFGSGATGAEPAGPTSVTVSWSPATDDQTAPGGVVYRVYWTDKAGGALTLGAVSDPGATSIVVSGLPAAEQQYYFRTQAVDAAGNADANKVDVRGTTGADTQAPVFGGCRSVSEISASTATVTWAEAVDDTTIGEKISYTVYASDVTIEKGQSLGGLEVGTFKGKDASGRNVTSGQVTGLNPSTLYRFVCRAKDEKGNEDRNLVLQTGKTSSDGDPPTFAGVVSEVADSTSIDLTWVEATDNQTEKKNMRYRVYASTTSGDQDFANPIAVSAPGVPGMSLSKSNLILAKPTGNVSNTEYYIVVRAADGAGNVDQNKVELKATTLVSFADDVQPVFTAKCALAGCHSTLNPDSPPMQGQNLELGAALQNIVNVPAREAAPLAEPSLVRVSRSKVLTESYMYRKITGVPRISGSTMPPSASSAGDLTPDEKAIIIGWIAQGANDN